MNKNNKLLVGGGSIQTYWAQRDQIQPLDKPSPVQRRWIARASPRSSIGILTCVIYVTKAPLLAPQPKRETPPRSLGEHRVKHGMLHVYVNIQGGYAGGLGNSSVCRDRSYGPQAATQFTVFGQTTNRKNNKTAVDDARGLSKKLMKT